MLAKKILPQKLIDTINSLLARKIILKGSFNTWDEAKKNTFGYNDNSIFKKAKKSLNMVMNKSAKFERDTVLFYKHFPDKEFISIIKKIYKKKDINICDFGGSFASSYFQNINFLKKDKITWNVVEQKKYVDYANKKLKIKNLKFYSNLNSVLSKKVDLVIFSSVLQYLKFPYRVLNKVCKKKIQNVLILRTPFSKNLDEIKIQIVPKHIYESSYPVRILNYNKFIKFMKKNGYSIKKIINTNEKIDKQTYKGIYFVRS